MTANTKYKYEENEINRLLEYKVKILQLETPIEVLAAVDNAYPELLNKYLASDKKRNDKNARKILIPYNLGLQHWVGIMLEINEDNKCTVGYYIDPLGKTNQNEKQQIEKMIQKIYPEAKLQDKVLLVQNDLTSCGPLTIENLILCALDSEALLEVSPGAKDIRNEQLRLIELNDRDFYEKFYLQQLNNISTVASLHEQLRYH